MGKFPSSMGAGGTMGGGICMDLNSKCHIIKIKEECNSQTICNWSTSPVIKPDYLDGSDGQVTPSDQHSTCELNYLSYLPLEPTQQTTPSS